MATNFIGAGLFMTICTLFFLYAVLVCSRPWTPALVTAFAVPHSDPPAPPLVEVLIRAPYRLQVCADREDEPEDGPYQSELERFTEEMSAWSGLPYTQERALPLYNRLFGNPELLEDGGMTIDEVLFSLERNSR